MTTDQLEDWILKYCPSDRDPQELIDRLAIGAISVVEECSKRMNTPVDEILARFYWDDGEVTTN